MMCCREPCSYVIVVLEGYAHMLPTSIYVYILEGTIVRYYIYYSGPFSHVTGIVGNRFHMLCILERTTFHMLISYGITFIVDTAKKDHNLLFFSITEDNSRTFYITDNHALILYVRLRAVLML